MKPEGGAGKAGGEDEAKRAPRLFDMHCHLDFLSEPARMAAQAESIGLGILAVGVEPASHEALAGTLKERPALRLAVGAHPWWIDGRRAPKANIARVCELVEKVRFVGEAGLDFSRSASAEAQAMQTRALERIAASCARAGDRVLSIHAVRSAGVALDILEAAGTFRNCTCIFHWFSGSSEELWRAIRAGAWFSMNERQLRTRRGLEYARLVPDNRLLLESDLPAENGSGVANASDLLACLERALKRLAEARGHNNCEELREILAANSLAVLERHE